MSGRACARRGAPPEDTARMLHGTVVRAAGHLIPGSCTGAAGAAAGARQRCGGGNIRGDDVRRGFVAGWVPEGHEGTDGCAIDKLSQWLDLNAHADGSGLGAVGSPVARAGARRREQSGMSQWLDLNANADGNGLGAVGSPFARAMRRRRERSEMAQWLDLGLRCASTMDRAASADLGSEDLDATGLGRRAGPPPDGLRGGARRPAGCEKCAGLQDLAWAHNAATLGVLMADGPGAVDVAGEEEVAGRESRHDHDEDAHVVAHGCEHEQKVDDRAHPVEARAEQTHVHGHRGQRGRAAVVGGHLGDGHFHAAHGEGEALAHDCEDEHGDEGEGVLPRSVHVPTGKEQNHVLPIRAEGLRVTHIMHRRGRGLGVSTMVLVLVVVVVTVGESARREGGRDEEGELGAEHVGVEEERRNV
eukprot:CAMPEP_0206035538 /NCGR_PEP_ID=MMETSP1466-20131121/2151_1 /ASSEMBLY_ACC=CAM_ASM_001126 /TAXON_ID=44452 /ORGANISM="Pavlova gyrans, Strain CCMP608" /LENGTH=416 /DNA_ID=CAMNT_0053409925 /DNA_START=95 /DNA_END=1343 /DNA_ORIENTATION=-